MQKNEVLLEKLKKMIEAELSWGDSSNWVNQDFIALSKKMNEKTSNSLSSVTLKRVWKKVSYDGLPQIYTLNTLAKFVGYESWRDFVVHHGDLHLPSAPEKNEASKYRIFLSRKQIVGVLCCIAIGIAYGGFKLTGTEDIQSSAYSFNSHTTIKGGLPNSVVFNFDATKATEDSVIIQQSWDMLLRKKVAKEDSVATMIYYFPGYFNPKLIVGGKIVKEHGLLIRSDGWIAALLSKDIPVYFDKKDIIHNGEMSVSVAKIKSRNIAMTPKPPILSFCNVKDFGPLYSDDFDFEISLKNDTQSENSVCQMTNIYLLCEGTAINIPLCKKGCESALNFFFTSHEVSGKTNDLSAFGVNFNTFVKIAVHSKGGKAEIFLNDKLAYVVGNGIMKSKIIGIDIAFQGAGSVDYVKLSNKKINFKDEF